MKELYKQASLLLRYYQEKQECTEDVKEWFPGCTGLLPFLGSIATIFPILLFSPCILNYLVEFSCLEHSSCYFKWCYTRDSIHPTWRRGPSTPMDKAVASSYSLLSTSAVLRLLPQQIARRSGPAHSAWSSYTRWTVGPLPLKRLKGSRLLEGLGCYSRQVAGYEQRKWGGCLMAGKHPTCKHEGQSIGR